MPPSSSCSHPSTPPTTDSRPFGRRGHSPHRNDEVDPNATRCLFVGNIPKGVSVYELRDTFLPFGLILVRVDCERHFPTYFNSLLSVQDSSVEYLSNELCRMY